MAKRSEFNKFLGEKIRTLRDIHGMKQMDLAFKLGYESTGMVSQIENGLKCPSLERIRKCADIFGVPIGSLLGDKEYSREDLELLKKVVEIIDSPPGKRHKHYEAVKLLLESDS